MSKSRILLAGLSLVLALGAVSSASALAAGACISAIRLA